MSPFHHHLLRILRPKQHDYEAVATGLPTLRAQGHYLPSSRHAYRRILTCRSVLLFIPFIPVLLISIILFSGFPALYADIRGFESRFPQHNVSYSESRGVKYLAFPDHMWGHGWNNVLQEYLMYSYLAYITNRSYVFDDYTWSHFPLPYTIYDFALRPTRVPLNAFISGPLSGGPLPPPSRSAPRAVHSKFWDKICPREKRHVISSTDVPANVWGLRRIEWWRNEIAKFEDLDCLQIDTHQEPMFSFSFFGGYELLDVWPSLSQTPIVTSFEWSPLVSSAVDRNFVALSDSHEHLSTPQANQEPAPLQSASSTASALTAVPTHPSLVALHIRRGDYNRHCTRLAQWGLYFHGFNSFEGLPDPWIPFTGSLPSDEAEEYYRKRCLPTQDEIVERLHSVRAEYDLFITGQSPDTNATQPAITEKASPPLTHRLRRVFVLSNAWPAWLNGLKQKLIKDGWDDVVFGGDLILDKEQRGVDVAVDMSIAERAEVFVGNGFSSLSGNIIMLRTAKGFHSQTNRLL